MIRFLFLTLVGFFCLAAPAFGADDPNYRCLEHADKRPAVATIDGRQCARYEAVHKEPAGTSVVTRNEEAVATRPTTDKCARWAKTLDESVATIDGHQCAVLGSTWTSANDSPVMRWIMAGYIIMCGLLMAIGIVAFGRCSWARASDY